MNFLTSFLNTMQKNNKSKKNILLLIILIVLLFVIAFKSNDNDSIITEKTINKQTVQSSSHKIKNSNQSVQNKTQLINPKTISELPNQLYYSDDPFINDLIIGSLYTPCFLLFNEHQNKDIENSYIYKNKSHKTKNKISKQFEQCKKTNDKHPEFNLTDGNEHFEKSYNSNTLLEKATNREVKISDDILIGRKFIDEIRHLDSRILLSPSLYYLISEYHTLYSITDVMQILKSQQIHYVLNILETAQTIYACNTNGGCFDDSLIMFFLCINNEENCHFENHNEYIRNSMTQGQQADLVIVVKYIETLFEIQ